MPTTTDTFYVRFSAMLNIVNLVKEVKPVKILGKDDYFVTVDVYVYYTTTGESKLVDSDVVKIASSLDNCSTLVKFPKGQKQFVKEYLSVLPVTVNG